MAKTTSAAYPQTIRYDYAVATAATGSLNDDTPTNMVTLLTAAGEGNRVTKIWAVPRATSTAGVLYLWVSTDSGSTKRLALTKSIAANTVSATSAPVCVEFCWNNDVARPISATSAPVPVEFCWNNDSARPISESEPFELENGAILYAGYSQALSDGMVFNTISVEY